MGAGASANSSAKKLQSKLQEELTKPLDVHDVHTLGEAKEEIARLRKALRDVQGALGGGGGSAESSPRRTSHFHEHLVHEKHAQGQTFDMVYEVGSKVLGEGMTSCVKICTNIKTGHKYALKTLQINRLDPSKMAELRDEITIMKALDHPNIVRLYDVYEERNKMYLVLEYCEGGELFDRLFQQEGGHFTEKKTAQLVEKMLAAIHFMHGKNVCHRDLKLENFIFEDKSPESQLKLIDFGLSHRYAKDENMRNILGTSYYMAPEVLKQKYTNKCDLWSIGVITYMLLSGIAPFSGDTDVEILKRVRVSEYTFPDPQFSKISSDAKDFVARLLQKDVSKRMDTSQALKHRWILSNEEQIAPVPVSVFESLKKFKSFGNLKKAALVSIAYHLDHEEINDLRAAFEAIDTEKNGYITASELRDVMRASSMKDDDVQRIFTGIDQDQSGQVDYVEFLAAAMEQKTYLNEEKMHEAFETFDQEGSGYITQDNLKEIMGDDFKPEVIAEMIKEGDFEKSGRINFESFCRMMKGDKPSPRSG